MAIFLVYSTSSTTSGKKVCRELKMAAILKILNYWTQLQFDLRYEKIVPNYVKKVFSWWWRHRWRHREASNRPSIFLYKWNKIFMKTRNREKISSLNSLCVSIMRLWLHLYRYIFMTSLMTSPGHKVGQILKLIYLNINIWARASIKTSKYRKY